MPKASPEEGDHRQAIEDYDKAIELNPKDAAAYVERGSAYIFIGDYRQAIKDFNKGIALKPDFAAAYVGRATAYLVLGDYSQVINHYKIAARLGHKGAQEFLRSQGINW